MTRPCLRSRSRARLAPAAAALLVLLPTEAVAAVDLPARGDRSVYDTAAVISAGHREIMERTHKDLLARTGVTVSVVTFPRLGGETLATVLARAAPAWGLGEQAGERGIVVGLAIEERQVLIATGQGVEDFLPQERRDMIVRQFIIPRLLRNDISQAMLQASAALVAAASQRYGVTVQAPSATTQNRHVPIKDLMSPLIVVLFLLGLAVRPVVLRLVARRRAGESSQ